MSCSPADKTTTNPWRGIDTDTAVRLIVLLLSPRPVLQEVADAFQADVAEAEADLIEFRKSKVPQDADL